jgi:cytochrome c
MPSAKTRFLPPLLPELLFLSLLFVGSAQAADAKKGEALYGRCLACHALEQDRVGPRHCGVVGRKAGSVPDFEYSEAMKRSGLTWDAKTLDRFLANPMKVVPGTTMTYAGISDPSERADLIAYLRTIPCPKP